ncbi:hypothetical protein ABBQ38_012072 [Trebouxia sp. C0009 RCD-2024]
MTKPLLDKKATDQLNLSVLRRVDPDTEQVLTTAGHVALYGFDTDKKAWSRKDVEGSLFLLKRQTQPRFRIVILNKKSQDNFVEDILGDFKFEIASPYILYRSKSDEVIGIWFYDENESAMVSGLLQRITSAYKAQSPPDQLSAPVRPPPPAVQSSTPAPQDDAFWDKRNTDSSAEIRTRLLQPSQSSDLAPPPPPSHQPAPALDGGAGDAGPSPFGLVGNPPPEETYTTPNQSHSAQASSLTKLLSSSSRPVPGSPPRALSSPGPLPTSPAMQRATETEEEQHAPNPLSALFANMKVSSMGTPTAQTPPPHLKPPTGTAPPANSPALLTPSFFRQHSLPQETSQAGTQVDPLQQEAGNSLQQVFARAASKSTPRTDASDASLQAQLFPARMTPQSSTARNKLRQAMLELANSDAFLDLIAEKLQSGGVQL